ncbi:5-oxoprolinase subunit B/C family protein [Microbacterium festucae]|uniref:5-oxoprolinase subunit B/C family protein n=1 Tax=Microbacterium festucae TaxID=2977531 RepID=UPI0036F1C039
MLAEVDTLDDVLALHTRLQSTRPPGVIDLVPAARTVLVHVDPARLTLAAARGWLLDTSAAASAPPRPASVVDLPITYDGADLHAVAALLGMSPDALAARHAAAAWTVAFTGFAPGFGYLVSPDWTLDVPRLTAPRTRVPQGAVGLAGAFTGAYPRETPGGWQLIGTTAAPLFDPAADPPALLAPGSRVRVVVVPATATIGAPAPAQSSTPPATPPAAPALVVRDPGLRATVQDLGRPGHLAEGIAPAGAADRGALRTANRLVGNPEAAAGIEIALGGFRATARADLWVAVTGAWGPVRIGGRAVDPYTAVPWPAGEELHIDWAAHGARAYLAVRGGVEAPAVARSRSTDSLSGLGPPALAAGSALALAGEAVAPVPASDLHPWSPPDDTALEVALAPGPRADWFTPAAHRALFDAVWTVSNEADRVGIRLDGPALARIRTAELPSEGMLPGAIQVPPSGQPVILGPDGPVTGGYPVIAVVADDSLDALAQARPGTRVRFRHTR